MNNEAFKNWLIRQNAYSSVKQITDCVSRVKRAERALQDALGSEFTLDSQFESDGGDYVRKLLSRRGMTHEMQKLDVPNLPIGTNQMDSIAAAVRKYFIFKREEVA